MPASKGYSEKDRQATADVYARYPVGMWLEIVYDTPAPANPPAPQLLLMERSSLTGGAS
jgi:hypothetical protein